MRGRVLRMSRNWWSSIPDMSETFPELYVKEQRTCPSCTAEFETFVGSDRVYCTP